MGTAFPFARLSVPRTLIIAAEIRICLCDTQRPHMMYRLSEPGTTVRRRLIRKPAEVPAGIPAEGMETDASAYAGQATFTGTRSFEAAYCGLVKHVLLIVLTCGIRDLIRICHVTGATNGVPGEEDRDPARKLLLCLFIPFDQVCRYRQTALRVDRIAQLRGTESGLKTLVPVLALLLPILPPILVQERINGMTGPQKA